MSQIRVHRLLTCGQNIAVLVLAVATTTTLIIYQKGENAKRARGERDGRLVKGEEALLGHRDPNFRYTL